MDIKMIIADEGKVFTDGEIYGKVIYLGAKSNEKDFYQITDEEAKRLQEEKEAEDVE